MSKAQCLLEEMLGIMLEDRVQDKLPQPTMLLRLVTTVVHKVLNVIVGPDVLSVLRKKGKKM